MPKGTPLRKNTQRGTEKKPRQPRTPKEVQESPTQITSEEKIANYISVIVCSVPGCGTKMHLEDARNILHLIKEVDKK